MSIITRRLYYCGLALWVVPALCIVLAFCSSAVPRNIPLPLGELTAVAVDHDGRIYCLSSSYARVQAYSPEGRFLTAWTPPNRKLDGLHVDTDGNIVCTSHSRPVYTYSPDGRLLDMHAVSPDDARSDSLTCSCRDAQGNTYTIRWASLYPHIVRTDTSDQARTVIGGPGFAWLIMAPLPAMLYAFIGVGVLGWASYRAQKERANRQHGV